MQSIITFALALLHLTIATSALPISFDGTFAHGLLKRGVPAGAAPDLSQVSGLTVPSGQSVFAVGLGRGVQNYTCTSGNFTSSGALATLYNISSMADNTALLAQMTPEALAILPSQYPSNTPNQAKRAVSNCPELSNLDVLGHHYFVSLTAGAAASPKFDFTPAGQSADDSSEYVVTKKDMTAAAPTDPTKNVAWLSLSALPDEGTLAKTVLRVNTAGGQPPATCTTEGQNISVDYAAEYWFFA